MKTGRKIIIVVAHVAAWTCFFLLPYILYPQQSINKRIHISVIADDFFLVLFYYVNTLVLIPHLLFKQKNVWYILINIACLFIFLYFPRFIVDYFVTPQSIEVAMQQLHPHHNNNHTSPTETFRRNRFTFPISLYLLTYTVGTCIAVMQRWLKTERNRQEMENEKLNTELSFLKSQINPHFFFNTLNNIYSLAVTDSNQTAAAIMKLASIMRYIISDTGEDKVELNSEIEFIKNYIDLQLFRLTDKVNVQFIYDGDIDDKTIIPLLFMPFVENAFKYGVSTKEKTSISISLKAVKNALNFTVVNTIFAHKGVLTEATGIGIQNVKRRLQLVYPDNHTLQVFEQNNQFHVELNINLK